MGQEGWKSHEVRKVGWAQCEEGMNGMLNYLDFFFSLAVKEWG